MKRHTIHIPIYNGILHVVDCEDLQQAIKDTKSEHECEDHEHFDAFVTSNHDINPGNWFLFIDLKNCDLSLLVHELFHAAHRVLEYFGIKFTTKNHEPFAYLIEYLFNECLKLKSDER
jgi:hypothetical protein